MGSTMEWTARFCHIFFSSETLEAPEKIFSITMTQFGYMLFMRCLRVDVPGL